MALRGFPPPLTKAVSLPARFPENRLYFCGWKLMVEAFNRLPTDVGRLFLHSGRNLHKQTLK
jgi:hypothetical protein